MQNVTERRQREVSLFSAAHLKRTFFSEIKPVLFDKIVFVFFGLFNKISSYTTFSINIKTVR